MTFRAWVYKTAFPVAKLYWRIRRPKGEGSAVIIVRDGNILCVRHTYGSGKWSFPGGDKKRNEKSEDAGRREILEETGLVLNAVSEVGKFLFTKLYRNDIVHVFVAHVAGAEITSDPDEILEARWVPLHEVPSLEKSLVGQEIWNTYNNWRQNRLQ